LNPLSNIQQTAAGVRARTRPCYACTGGGEHAPDVFLSTYLLRAILALDSGFNGNITITALAGFLENEGFITQRNIYRYRDVLEA